MTPDDIGEGFKDVNKELGVYETEKRMENFPTLGPSGRTGYPREQELQFVSFNFGPQHPAAHGVLRLVLSVEGEVIFNWIVPENFNEKLLKGCHQSSSSYWVAPSSH